MLIWFALFVLIMESDQTVTAVHERLILHLAINHSIESILPKSTVKQEDLWIETSKEWD